jgi:type II secretory pathway predicted ATPase ExeA
VLPIPLPAQGKLGERRAREIKTPTLTEDPRRLYFKLLLVLSIVLPDTLILDEFIEEVKKLADHKIPKVTSKLMADALIKKINEVRRLEEKLVLLHHLVEGGAEGGAGE